MVLFVGEMVEPGHFVMKQMPKKVLHVEKEKASQYILNNSEHLGCHWRRKHGSEVPVHDRHGENEPDMVVKNLAQTLPSQCPCHPALRLDLEASYQSQSVIEQIQTNVRQAATQVDSQREQNWEKWRSEEALLSQPVPKNLQREPLCAL